ncbi:Biopolymer transport protein ExbD/TolR [Anaeromyxobacter sp. K]|uniref:ExbD/TolR family protein n=1 Tax=Anaeromyxobacter sp. (strain K) TaxID=447217 RepID=UPI00017BE301|nr:biopolymer transporter ExbD [Anaeromyxobacter sp. K]ACG72740.1 Biopolymer transport protein ExbD/TolR [Anaeromyxobacter sp. K]
MAAHSNDPDDAITGINVTPLVDVTLVLLVVFMVTATYVVKDGIDVDLPRAASGGESTGPTLAFTLDRGGHLFLDGAPVERDAARAAVRAALARSPEARAVIGADRAASHGAVVSLIDLVKTEGLTRFAIQIEREDAGAAR